MGVGFSAWAAASFAQTTPGTVGDTLKKPPEVPQQKPPAAIVNEQKLAPLPPPPGTVSVAVQAFTFTGNKIFTKEELGAVVAPFTGRPLKLPEIYDAADKVAAYYVSKGYTLATVNVPPQKVDEGVIRLEVIEGRIAAIKVEGNLHYQTASLLEYLHGVKSGEVYQGSALADGLNTLNELPGLSTRAVLKPGDDYGTTDIVVQAREQFVQASATVDNYGRENIGEFRFTGITMFNSLFGVEDQLQLMGMVSEHSLLRYGYIAYSMPLDYRGSRLTGSYGIARFEVDNELDASIDGENIVGRLQLDHPFVRTHNDRFVAGIAVSNTSADATIEGLPTGSTDLTLLEINTSWMHGWGGGFLSRINTSLSSNFDQANFCDLHPGFGCPGSEATKPRDDQQFRGQLDTLHVLPMPQRFQALLRLDGVWSPDPLPDTQKFALGGPGSVRGYAASEVRGDRGWFTSLTLQRPFLFGQFTLLGRVFADTGAVYEVDTPPGVNDEETLSSIGLGADLRYQRVSMTLDASWPQDDQPSSDGDEDFRLFGSLAVSF